MVAKKSFTICIITIIVLLFVSSVGFAYAKFVASKSNDKLQGSTSFYFTSDAITGSPNATIYNIGQSVIIDIRNAEDTLRITETNIDYTITSSATNNYTNYTIQKDNIDTTGGSFPANVYTEHSIVFTALSGYEDETVVTINFNAISPYTKTLTMTITLYNQSQNYYYIEESTTAQYMTLIIVNPIEILNDTLTITWDVTELSVDNTNIYFMAAPTKLLDANDNYYSFNLAYLPPGSSVSIMFMKKDFSDNFICTKTTIQGNLITI